MTRHFLLIPRRHIYFFITMLCSFKIGEQVLIILSSHSWFSNLELDTLERKNPKIFEQYLKVINIHNLNIFYSNTLLIPGGWKAACARAFAHLLAHPLGGVVRTALIIKVFIRFTLYLSQKNQFTLSLKKTVCLLKVSHFSVWQDMSI